MFNKLIASILPYFPKKFIWIFSRAYISGVTMADAMRVSKELNAQGVRVTLDVLGEFTLADLVKDKDRMCGLLGLQCIDRIL